MSKIGNIEWYDIKTKAKRLVRALLYSWLFQELICYIILFYIYIVYYTSKKNFVNIEKIINNQQFKPVIAVFWHNRLMMIPFLAKKARNIANKNHLNIKFATLSSRHGDGRFVGKIMKKLSLVTIEGSTRNHRKSSRGIDFSSTRQIISFLKSNNIIGITPDGPRGPAKKINGDIIAISRLANANIIAVSYGSSKKININSWDKFTIPLPFSKLTFRCDDQYFNFANGITKQEEEVANSNIANRINLIEEMCDNSYFAKIN